MEEGKQISCSNEKGEERLNQRGRGREREREIEREDFGRILLEGQEKKKFILSSIE